MIFKRQTFTADANDAVLVDAARSGNRDAFAQIVERYQSLICALAYNSTGDLSQSEDLAQDTFLIAWRKMNELQDPQKLRPWLCGIARNIISNAWRRNKREPVKQAEPIDCAVNFQGNEKQTAERVIEKEEEAILWRSLEQIPEIYREPLILFYRQGESIERVAQTLDLSEDAVKQRLSRGRKLLAEEVTSFVEGALKQSAPGRAFTLGVIAALPVFTTSASAATIATGAAKGSTVANSFSIVALLGALLGPIIGVFGAYIGIKASLNSTRTPRERAFAVRQVKGTIATIVGFTLVLFGYIFAAQYWWKDSPRLVIGLGVLIPLFYTIWIIFAAVRYNRQFREIRESEKKLHPEAFANDVQTVAKNEYRSSRTLLGLPLIHISNGNPGEKSKPAIGWIAIGGRAYGILFAAGGFAVGGISMGGAAIGVISMGGASLGLLAIGGFAMGLFALGGAAVGLLAAGGIAVAWFGAQGGMAIAHEFAMGGLAFAKLANTAEAKSFFERFPWMDMTNPHRRNLLMTICWLPVLASVLLVLLQKSIQHRKKSRS